MEGGVCGVQHAKLTQTEVQGKGQTHMVEGNQHAGLLRSDSSDFIDSPPLYGRQIKQDGQYDKQQHGAQQDAQYPPKYFLHRRRTCKRCCKITKLVRETERKRRFFLLLSHRKGHYWTHFTTRMLTS